MGTKAVSMLLFLTQNEWESLKSGCVRREAALMTMTD
jgi:hypothetical protein